MEPKPTFKHDSEKDVQEFFLYGKPPSLAQTIAPVLMLSDGKHVHAMYNHVDKPAAVSSHLSTGISG